MYTVAVSIAQNWYFKKKDNYIVYFSYDRRNITLVIIVTTLGSDKLYIGVKSEWGGRGLMGLALPCISHSQGNENGSLFPFVEVKAYCYWKTQTVSL